MLFKILLAIPIILYSSITEDRAEAVIWRSGVHFAYIYYLISFRDLSLSIVRVYSPFKEIINFSDFRTLTFCNLVKIILLFQHFHCYKPNSVCNSSLYFRLKSLNHFLEVIILNQLAISTYHYSRHSNI